MTRRRQRTGRIQRTYTSRVCGPTLEVVKAVKADYPDVPFIAAWTEMPENSR